MRHVLAGGFAILLALVVVIGVTGLLLNLFAEGDYSVPTAVTPAAFAEPPLQENPQLEWQALKATQEAHLNSYGWVNEETDLAHIPIERAMELAVEQGLPTPRPTVTPAAEGSGGS